MNIEIAKIARADYPAVAAMVGELLEEIRIAIDTRAFNFSLEEATTRLADFVEANRYQVFVARDVATKAEVGCLTMHESYSIYAGGAFGTIPELYVRPGFR